MELKVLFLIGVFAAGLTEYVKKILPASFVEKQHTCPVIAGIISAISAVVYAIYFAGVKEVMPILVSAILVIALTQTSYTLMFKTFEAIKKRLIGKLEVPYDSEVISEEVAEKIAAEVEKQIKK